LGAALALHEIRAVNMVMTGAASQFLPLLEERYMEALTARLPARFVDVNAQAFRAGRALVAKPGAGRWAGPATAAAAFLRMEETDDLGRRV